MCRIVTKVENALIGSGKFQLPGKKQLLDSLAAAKLVVIDATETPIERPKKGQKRFYSGMKLRHMFKTQARGRPENFHRLFVPRLLLERSMINTSLSAAKSNSRKRRFGLADKGYQGIQKLHANSQLPKKKRKGKQLSQLDREMNQKLERVRGICCTASSAG